MLIHPGPSKYLGKYHKLSGRSAYFEVLLFFCFFAAMRNTWAGHKEVLQSIKVERIRSGKHRKWFMQRSFGFIHCT